MPSENPDPDSETVSSSKLDVTAAVSLSKVDSLSTSSVSTATGSSLRRGRFEISEVDSPSSSIPASGIVSSSSAFIVPRRASFPSVIEESAVTYDESVVGEFTVSVSVPTTLVNLSVPSLKQSQVDSVLPPALPSVPTPMSSMAVGDGSPTFSSSSMLESSSSTLQLMPTPAAVCSATSSPVSTSTSKAVFSKTEPLSLTRGPRPGELILSAAPKKSGIPRASSEVPLGRRRSVHKKTFSKGRFVVRDISSPVIAIDSKKVDFLDQSFEEEDTGSYEEDEDDVEDEEELELKEPVKRRVSSPRKMTSPLLTKLSDSIALNSARTIRPVTSTTTEDAKALKSSLQVFASIPRGESLATLKTKLAEVLMKERKHSSSSDSMVDDDAELNKMDLILHIVTQHFESCHSEIEELRKQNETLRAVNRRMKISAACRSPSV